MLAVISNAKIFTGKICFNIYLIPEEILVELIQLQ